MSLPEGAHPPGLVPCRPRETWRSQVVRSGRPAPHSTGRALEASPRAAGNPGAWSWATLLRRVLALDLLACPRCGGRLRVIATEHDPPVVRTLPAHLARSGTRKPPGPAPPAALA